MKSLFKVKTKRGESREETNPKSRAYGEPFGLNKSIRRLRKAQEASRG